MGFRAVKVQTSRGIRWASPTSKIARSQYGGGGGSGGGGGGSYAAAPTYVTNKSGQKVVYTAGGQTYYKTTSGQKVIIPKSTVESTGWSLIGSSTTGTPIWQKQGSSEFLRSDVIPSISTKGIAPKVKGSVYFTSNPAFVPSKKDATVIFLTPGGKTTGQVFTQGSAKTGLYSLGIKSGLDVTLPGDMSRLSKAMTQAEQFKQYYTQQNKQQLVAFKKAQAREQQEAIGFAIQQAQFTYERKLESLTKEKYKISDSRWKAMTPFEQKYYKDKYLVALDKPVTQSMYQQQQKRKKARYAHSLSERVAVQSPGVSAYKGTTLKGRLGR